MQLNIYNQRLTRKQKKPQTSGTMLEFSMREHEFTDQFKTQHAIFPNATKTTAKPNEKYIKKTLLINFSNIFFFSHHKWTASLQLRFFYLLWVIAISWFLFGFFQTTLLQFVLRRRSVWNVRIFVLRIIKTPAFQQFLQHFIWCLSFEKIKMIFAPVELHSQCSCCCVDAAAILSGPYVMSHGFSSILDSSHTSMPWMSCDELLKPHFYQSKC